VTRATACALLAGVLGALALADLVASRRPRRARGRGGRGIALLLRLGRALGSAGASGDLAARVAAAGAPLGLAPSDVMALKAGGALVGALAGLPFAAAAPGRLGPVTVLAAAGAGFLAPDAWLRRRTRRRTAVMARELPDVLDLLRVALAAGLPVTRALAEVGRRHPGLLAAELRATAGAIELGTRRSEALHDLPPRVPVPAAAALVAAIERAERHGAPLAGALEALAVQARAEAARALTERAARAAPKIQLVVALLLVPAVLCLAAAGAIAGLAPR
jgi:tight adherence protein C